MKNVKRAGWAALALIGILAGCGGGGGSSASGTSNTDTVKGYLVDAGVEGVTYTCEDNASKMGLTDKDGAFTCSGYPVRFAVGSVVLGTLYGATQDGMVYPQDLAGVGRDDFDTRAVSNIARFLQSLDADKDPKNGIKITDEVRQKFTSDVTIDLSSAAIDIATIIGSVDGSIQIVSAENALAHLKESMGIDSGNTEGEGTSGDTSMLADHNLVIYANVDSGNPFAMVPIAADNITRYEWSGPIHCSDIGFTIVDPNYTPGVSGAIGGISVEGYLKQLSNDSYLLCEEFDYSNTAFKGDDFIVIVKND